MIYPVWIHCSKRPKLQTTTSAFHIRLSSNIIIVKYSHLRQISSRCCMQKHYYPAIFHGGSQKITLTVFWTQCITVKHNESTIMKKSLNLYLKVVERLHLNFLVVSSTDNNYQPLFIALKPHEETADKCKLFLCPVLSFVIVNRHF